MVWGCLAAHGVGRFYLVESIMLKEQYVSILENHMYPSTMMLFPDQDFIFQEDNDPKHTARVTKQWFIDKGINRMDWPAQGPDLNPNENLWSILDGQLKDRSPKDREELFSVLKEGWNNLEPALLTKLVDSMPRRCQAVINSNGYATMY